MAYLFSRRQGISSHLQTIWGARVFHPVALLKLMFLYTEMCVSGNLWIVVKDVKTLVVYDVEYEMSMDSMNGKCASSWVDLGYTNLFCIPELTSVFFSCCDSGLGDSLQFNQWNRGSLRLWLGTRNSSARNAGESGLIFWRGGSLMSFLELRQAPGIYSRVKAGMAIWNPGLFSEVRTPVSLWRTPREVFLFLAGKYRSFWRWAGRPSVPFSWHSYIGIPINFHEESGIVTFWSTELSAPLEVSNGCEALCPEEVENYGFL